MSRRPGHVSRRRHEVGHRVADVTKTAYVGIKYHPDNRNRDLIERLSAALEGVGIVSRVVVRDVERWGEISMAPSELMVESLQLIRDSDIVVIEASEKGVGLGIEAGYAHAHSIPVVIIHREGAELSPTLVGIASDVFPHSSERELSPVAARILAMVESGDARSSTTQRSSR